MTSTATCKQAVLVVSFGTSYSQTCEKNIGAIEKDIGAAFPGWEVRRAFTSGMIIKKLRDRDGVSVDTVEEALERLAADGFQSVVCQPTHIINGEEYDDLRSGISKYAGRFESLALGTPLLTTTQDYRLLAQAVSRAHLPQSDTSFCLMGHGTRHFSDSAYAAFDYHLKDLGRGDIFVGTVEGYPDVNTLLEQVAWRGSGRIVLAPLMVVSGDHAVNDMVGSEEDSWKSRFESAGYDVEVVLKGLGEYPEIRALYVRHAREAAPISSR